MWAQVTSLRVTRAEHYNGSLPSPGAGHRHTPSPRLFRKWALMKERPHLPGCVDAEAVRAEHPSRCYPLTAGPLMSDRIEDHFTAAVMAFACAAIGTRARIRVPAFGHADQP